jgi:hypothetical protein
MTDDEFKVYGDYQLSYMLGQVKERINSGLPVSAGFNGRILATWAFQLHPELRKS